MNFMQNQTCYSKLSRLSMLLVVKSNHFEHILQNAYKLSQRLYLQLRSAASDAFSRGAITSCYLFHTSEGFV